MLFGIPVHINGLSPIVRIFDKTTCPDSILWVEWANIEEALYKTDLIGCLNDSIAPILSLLSCSVSSPSLCSLPLCSACLSSVSFQGDTLQLSLHRELLSPLWLWGKLLVFFAVHHNGTVPSFLQPALPTPKDARTRTVWAEILPSVHMGIPSGD